MSARSTLCGLILETCGLNPEELSLRMQFLIDYYFILSEWIWLSPMKLKTAVSLIKYYIYEMVTFGVPHFTAGACISHTYGITQCAEGHAQLYSIKETNDVLFKRH